MSADIKPICVGSRKSELALIQTRHVIASLQKIDKHSKFEIHTMTTMGDRVLNVSLPKIGEKALFTKDLEDALHSGRVDFVVHSLKDLPTVLPVGLAIGAILEREDPRDALVLRKDLAGASLKTLPEGSIIGTSSLRRCAQIARKYPNIIVQDIRGNLNTRLAKLDAPNSKFSAIILAQAGLVRMGWQDRISQTLDADDILYAVGQGALAVECRSNDTRILAMLQKLSCLSTQCRILTERSFLKTLGGGCSAPVAVVTNFRRSTEVNANDAHEMELHITGAVWSLDGKVEVQSDNRCSLNLNIHERPAVEEIIPCKRAKVCTTPEPQTDDNNDFSAVAEQPAKADSPTVIDDTKIDIPSSSDMASLLKIHGDLLKKCPYAASHHASGASDKCPLNIAVGQDVMGQCPYLNAEQKVLMTDVKAASSENATTAALTNSGAGKCPFLSDVESKITTKDEVDKSTATAPKVCPFKKKSTTSSDTTTAKDTNANLHEEEGGAGGDSSKSAESSEDSNETVDDTTLYCGLYRHQCYNINWFEQCERLGQQLAKNLIDRGALAVMEKAQLEIRKAI